MPSERMLVGLLLLCGLVGCIQRADGVTEDLTPTSPGEFRYTATASMLHPANSPEGERFRQRRMRDLLLARGMCPQGFTILGRNPPLGPAGAGSEQYLRNLVYSGRCA